MNIRQNAKGEGNQVAGRDLIITNTTPLPPGLPSLLAHILPQIANFDPPNMPQKKPIEYSITGKITYNTVSIHKETIESYTPHAQMLEELYNTIAQEYPKLKSKILDTINLEYKSHMLEHSSNTGGDYIIHYMLKAMNEKINEILLRDPQNFTKEDIPICSAIIISHAFIHCKILKAPPDTNTHIGVTHADQL